MKNHRSWYHQQTASSTTAGFHHPTSITYSSDRRSENLYQKLGAALSWLKDLYHQADPQQLWDWYFAAVGSRMWNSLPAGLRQTDISYKQFKRLIKTCLGVEIAAHCDYLFELRLSEFSSLYYLLMHVTKILQFDWPAVFESSWYQKLALNRAAFYLVQITGARNLSMCYPYFCTKKTYLTQNKTVMFCAR